MSYLLEWLNIDFVSQYSLYDLMSDAPQLFSRIFRSTIEADDGYDFNYKRVYAYEAEMAAITAAQWEAFGGQDAKAKAHRYDYELQKIKNDLLWMGLRPLDMVEVVFWQDAFDPLVSFAKKQDG